MTTTSSTPTLRQQRARTLGASLKNKGYRETALTIPIREANSRALLTALPFMGLVTGAFLMKAGLAPFLQVELDLMCLMIFLFIPVHEAIHGLCFALFAPSHLKAVSFGVVWKSLNPYCYCAEPVSRRQYLVAALAPCAVLGGSVGVAAVLMESATWLLVSLTSFLCAGGDLMVARKLLDFPAAEDALFLDHPDQPGLIAYVRA